MSLINESSRFLVESWNRFSGELISKIINANDSNEAELKFSNEFADTMNGGISIRDLTNVPCTHSLENVKTWFTSDSDISDTCSICENN